MKKQYVLLVDDDLDLRETLCEMMNELLKNVEIVQAKDGADALDILSQKEYTNYFDLIISDIHMPEVDGLSLLERIRQIDIFTPVIMLTGYGDKEKAVRALRAGAYDFIDKPFEPVSFLKTIASAIGVGQSLRQHERALSIEIPDENIPEDKIKQYKQIRRKIHAMKSLTPKTGRKAS